MSKTFRKFPSAKDYSRSYTSYIKRVANKTVRKNWEISNGKDFKKCFCSWNIVDYKWILYDEKDFVYFPWLKEHKFESRSKAKKRGKIFSKDSIRKME